MNCSLADTVALMENSGSQADRLNRGSAPEIRIIVDTGV